MKADVRILFATNDWRSKQLADELGKKVSQLSVVEYDPIPAYYKYMAAMMTYHPNRMVWWNKFQWHPLVQKGRRAKLLSDVARSNIQFDILVMWGSWTDPLLGSEFSDKPFYFYIDQSCDKVVDEGDPVEDSPSLSRARRAFNADQFKSYQRAAGVLCMSSWAVEQTLRAHAMAPGKVEKIGWGPIGINLLDEDIQADAPVPTILFVGNEFHRKGVDFIRQAAPAIAAAVAGTQFNIVGANVDHLELPPYPGFNVLGAVRDPEKMKQLYRDAWLVVQPHRFDRSPHVLIEAMSAGKPIITSNQGGAREVVQHGHNGFTVDVGDVDALSGYAIELLKNEELRDSFGRNAKQIVADGYTWERIAQKIVDRIIA